MPEIELSQPGIDKLNDSLDRLVTAMNNVDRKLDAISKRKPVFERVFGDQQTFSDLIRTINKINEAGVEGFVKITNALKNLAKAITDIPSNNNFSKVVEQIRELTQAASKGKGDQSGVRNVANDIGLLSNALSTIKDSDKLAILASRLTSLFESMNKFDATKIAPFRLFTDTLKSFIGDMGSIGSSDNKIQAVFDKINIFGSSAQDKVENITRLSQAVGSLFRAMQGFDVSGIGDFRLFIDTLQDLFKKIGKLGTTQVKKLEVTAKAAILLITSLEKIDQAVRSAALSKTLNLNPLAAGLSSILAVFGENSGESLVGKFAQSLGGIVSVVVKLGVVFPALTAFIFFYTRIIGLLGVLTLPADIGLATLTANLRNISKAFVELSSAFGGNNKDASSTLKTNSERFFNSLRVVAVNVISIVASVVKLGVVFPIVFTVLAGVFKSIGLLASLIPGDDALKNLTQSIKRVGETFRLVSEALGGNSEEKLKPQALNQREEVFNAIGRFIRNIVSVVGNIVKIGVVFPILTAGLVVVFKGLGIISSIPIGNDALTKITTSINVFGQALKAISEALGAGSRTGGIGVQFIRSLGNIIKLGVIFPLVATNLVLVFKALGAVLSIGPGNEAIALFSKSIETLSLGLDKISKAPLNIEGVRRVSKALKIIADSLKGITVGLINKGILEPFIGVAQSLAGVSSGLAEASTASSAINLAGIIKLGLVFKVLAGTLANAVKNVPSGSEGAIKEFGNAARNLGLSIRSISLAIKQREDVKLLGIFDIIKIFLTFKSLLGVVANFSKGNDPQKIKGTADLLAAVGGVFKTLFRTIASADDGKTSDVVSLISVRQRIELIKNILTSLKSFRNKSLPDIAPIIVALSNALKSVGKISIDKSQIASFQEVIPALLNAIRSLKGAKLPKNAVDGLSALVSAVKVLDSLKGKNNNSIKSIVDLFTGISRAKINKSDFKLIGEFVSELVKGLKKLESVKTNQQAIDQLNALAGAVQALQKSRVDPDKLIPDVDQESLRKRGSQSGESLADGVEQGFLRANLKIFIGRVLADAFRALNPVALTGKFVDGISLTITKIRDVVRAGVDGIRNAGQELRDIGERIFQVGQKLFSNFGLGAIANSGAFGIASEFDRLSSQVKTFGNLTEEQLKSVQDFADKIGIDYPLSTNEALDATLSLTKAGLDLKETFNTLPAAADLSSVMDTADIDAASRIIIQATQTFKEFGEGVPATFKNVSFATDIYARAANASTASVESLAAGIAKVGPVASSFGITLEETAAILSIFADAGLADAEAGTQLKSVLTNITRDTPQVRAVFESLGVSLTDNAGKFKDINTIINELNHALNDVKTVTATTNNLTGEQKSRLEAATKAYASAARQVLIYNDGLSTGALDQEKANDKVEALTAVQANAQRVISEITGSQADTERITTEITRSQSENFRAIQTLAGSYGQAGLNILISQGDDAIAGFIEEMNRLPTAAEQAALLLDNLAGDAEQFRGSLETLTKKALFPLINRAFRPLVKFGKTVVDFFLNLPDPVLDVASNVILLGSALASLIGGLLIVVGIATQVGGVFVSLIGAAAFLAVNMASLIAAVITIAASFAALITIVAILVPIILSIATAFTQVIRSIEQNVGGAGDAFSRLRDTAQGVFDAIGRIISAGIDILSSAFGRIFNEGNISIGQRIAGVFDRIRESVELLRQKAEAVAQLLEAFGLFAGQDISASALLKGGQSTTLIEAQNNLLEHRKSLLDQIESAQDGLTNSTQSQLDYTILQGDTLSEIAAKYGTTVDELAKLNNIDDINRIFAGGTLKIPVEVESKDPIPQLQSQVNEINRMINAVSNASATSIEKQFGKQLESLTKLDVVKQLFGDDVTVGELAKFFDRVRNTLFKIRDAFKDIGSGLIGLLLGDKGAQKKLDSGLSRLGSLISKGISNITGIDLSRVILAFDQRDLSGGVQALINSLIEEIRNFIFKNKDTIINILSGVFNLLLPGKFIIPILRILGLDRAADAVQGVFDTINTLFRKSLGVLFDLMQGKGLKESILGNFGESALPVVRFIESITNAFGTLVFIVQDVVAALFPASEDPDGESFLAGLFNGLADAFAVLNDSVLIPIKNSLPTVIKLFQDVGTFVGSAINSLLDFGGKVGDLVGKGDFKGAIDTIAAGFGSLISGAIKAVPALITIIGTELNSPILTKIGEDLLNGDFKAVVDTIASGFLGIINNSIVAVPALITNLGTVLGSPILAKLGTDLANAGSFSEGLASISDAIAGLIQSALGDVPTRLQELGATLDLGFLKDLGITLGDSLVFQFFVTTLSNLLTFPQKVLSDVVDGLERAFDVFRKQKNADLGGLAVKLLLLGGAFTILINAVSGGAITGFIMTAISGGLKSIVGAAKLLGPALVHLLAFASVFLLVKNAIQNLDDLLRGDIVSFIGDTLAGMGSDLAGLFGVEISAEEISASISTSFDLLRFTLEIGLRRLANSLAVGVRNVFDGLLSELDEGRARADQALGFASTGTGDFFFRIVKNFEDGMDFNVIGQTLDEAAAKGIDLTPLERRLRTEFVAVMDEFRSQIPNLADLSDVNFSNVIKTLVGADALDDALLELDPIDIGPFLSRALTISPESFKNFDFSAMATQLEFLAASQQLDPIEVKDIILQIPDEVLSPEEKQRFLDRLQATLDFQGSLLTAEIPLEPEVVLENFVINKDNLQSLSDAAFRGLFDDLITTDTLDEALAQVPPANVSDLFSRLFAIAPDQLARVDFASVIAGLVDSGMSEVDLAAAKGNLTTLIFSLTNLSEDDKQRLADQVNGVVTTAVVDGTATAATEVPVTVTPEIVVTPENAAIVAEDINTAVEDAVTNAATTANPDVSVKPDVQLEIESVDDALVFTAALVDLDAKSELAKQSIQDVGTKSQETVPLLEGYAASTLTNTVLSTGAWVAHSVIVLFQTALIKTNIDAIGTATTLLSTNVQSSAVTIPTAFTTMANQAQEPINRLINKVRELKTEIAAAVGAFDALRNQDITNLPVVPTAPIAGRAGGGDVFAGRLYEVAERGISELLRIGSRTFLIPGQNGTVIPPVQSASRSAPPPVLQRSAFVGTQGQGRGVSVSQEIHIHIPGSAGNLTPEQIEKAVQRGLNKASTDNPIERQILIAGYA